MLSRIIYVSRASEGVTMRDVYDVIRVSHNRNSQAGITGGLMFADGYFVQLLEGLTSAVTERYARILVDDRHYEISKRQEELVETAIFESQWMALRDASTVAPSVHQRHQYKPGLPEEYFSGAQVTAWLLDCFDIQPTVNAS